MPPRRPSFLGALAAVAVALPAAAAAAPAPAPLQRAPASAAVPAGAQRLQAPTPAPESAGQAAAIRKARSFSLALGATLGSANVKRLAKSDLVVVDGDETSGARVRKLQGKGAIVLGYLSVGTVESWRPWFATLRDFRLEPLGDWDGERYADVGKPEVRTALVDAIAPGLLDKGFDGLFLDNVDMVENHPAQADGMLDLVTRLSAKVHAGGGALMAQNGDTIIGPYLPLLDAWNREDPTGTYDFATSAYAATDADGRRAARAAITAVKASGVLVTTTDYFASATSKAAARAVRIACKAGAVPFVGDIDLKKVAKKPLRC